MKTLPMLLKNLTLLLAVTFGPVAVSAGEPAQAAPADRVGIYDSRAVSFAHFWSAPVRRERDERIAAARAAKARGDDKQFKKLQKAIVAESKRGHLQVFSSAPADEAMAALQDKLPAIRKELGVTRFVSKWDRANLRGVAEAERVEATDRLVREFEPDAKRRQTIEAMKAKPPLPMWRMKLLLLFEGM